MFMGNFERASNKAVKLVNKLESFKPSVVITPCLGCHSMLSRYVDNFVDMSFKTLHVSQFIAENLDKLKFPETIKEKVTIHDPCHLTYIGGDYVSIRKILKSIPGIETVEMEHSEKNTICCGQPILNLDPSAATESGLRRLREAEATGANTLVTVCGGCKRVMSQIDRDSTFRITDYVSFMGKILGIEYEDKLTKYLRQRDVDMVLEDASEYLSEYNLSLNDIQMIKSIIYNHYKL